jgi:periplasmic divalent cation tolerance protein
LFGEKVQDKSEIFMTDALVVFCTCADEAEALRLANTLIEAKLVACVNILPAVQSIYRWQGSIEQAREILLIIKTMEARFEAVRDHISAHHGYDTPEILALPVAAGSEKYLAWLLAQSV